MPTKKANGEKKAKPNKEEIIFVDGEEKLKVTFPDKRVEIISF